MARYLGDVLDDAPLFAPLCLDALTARIAQQAGFLLGYVSGGALGYAHAVSEALLSLDELTDVVRHVTARSDIGIIVDGGVGFGDAVHLSRAVREFESAGAVAVEIEDQVAPKRVSHHRGIEHLVGTDVMVQKIEHAVRARASDDFYIIARTGAARNESFERACERARAYRAAGADMILIMPANDADWARVQGEVDAPLVTFGALGGRSAEAWQELGVSLVVDPFTAQVLAVDSIRRAYEGFMQDGIVSHDVGALFRTYNDLDRLAGFEELYAIEDMTTEKPSS